MSQFFYEWESVTKFSTFFSSLIKPPPLDRRFRQVQSPLRLLDFRKFLQIRQIEFEIKATGILSVHLGPR